MKSNGQLLTMWLGRIFANTVVGGFYFMGVGVLCGVVAGGLAGMLQSGWNGTYVGIFVGVGMGVVCGVPGSLIYAISAARASPGKILQPCETLFVCVSLGQFLGTVGAISAFVCVEIVRAHWQNIALAKIVADDSFLFMFFAPALMICGAIAGALWRRAPQ